MSASMPLGTISYPLPRSPDAIAAAAAGVASVGGFSFWTNGDFNLNCIGLRNSDEPGVADSFNDAMLMLWKDKGIWQARIWKITTDPGYAVSLSPSRSDGTARLCHDTQFKKLWALGKHKKEYTAGVQAAPSSDVPVWRDRPKNGVLSAGGTIYYNAKGINAHRANEAAQSVKVGGWSEGCQVNSHPSHFAEFVRLFTAQTKVWEGKGGDRLSYLLLSVRKDHPLRDVLDATL